MAAMMVPIVVVAANRRAVPAMMGPVAVTMAMAIGNGLHTTPVNLGRHAVRDLPRGCRSAGIGKRHRLCRDRWRRHKQQPRDREKAENLFHEFPLLSDQALKVDQTRLITGIVVALTSHNASEG
jgi:hypothetical protein